MKSSMRLLKPQVSKALGWLALGLVDRARRSSGCGARRPTAVQGDAQRLMYLHVPAAWIAYLAFGVTALASVLWLWPRTRATVWDRLAGASAEVGVIFTGLTLVLGSLWGRPVWGIWWAWDARLVTTAVLFFLYLGYLALRRIPATPRSAGQAVRDRRAHRVRRRADRPLLGDLVAHAAPAGHGVQRAASTRRSTA